METNWKIIVPIAIVGLVLIAVAMSTRDATPVAPAAPIAVESPIVTPPVDVPVTPTPPSVSGNVDDMLSILTGEASGDAAFAANVAESASVVKSDTQEVNSLTTAYDETTF